MVVAVIDLAPSGRDCGVGSQDVAPAPRLRAPSRKQVPAQPVDTTPSYESLSLEGGVSRKTETWSSEWTGRRRGGILSAITSLEEQRRGLPLHRSLRFSWKAITGSGAQNRTDNRRSWRRPELFRRPSNWQKVFGGHQLRN